MEEILKLLEMDSYADAVVGKTGEGLNVEERKRLTIGVEMVAKPELLLFLDEPSRCACSRFDFALTPETLTCHASSGLDSQTSWSIVNLLENLAKHGQSILCTSPSLSLHLSTCMRLTDTCTRCQSISPAPCSSLASIACCSSREAEGPSTTDLSERNRGT